MKFISHFFTAPVFKTHLLLQTLYYQVQGVRSISCVLPHHRESTGSRQITELNLGRASIVTWMGDRLGIAGSVDFLFLPCWEFWRIWYDWQRVIFLFTLVEKLYSTYQQFLSLSITLSLFFYLCGCSNEVYFAFFHSSSFQNTLASQTLYYKVQGVRSISCVRPHHRESTGSRQITEVNLGRASIVLGWVTTWE